MVNLSPSTLIKFNKIVFAISNKKTKASELLWIQYIYKYKAFRDRITLSGMYKFKGVNIVLQKK